MHPYEQPSVVYMLCGKLFSNRVRFFRTGIHKWFAIHGRLYTWRTKSATPYIKIISESLLQRTRADVIQAFLPGFIRAHPSWKSIAAARITDLERKLKPVGLWRRRARSMRGLARIMVARRGRFPLERDQILLLPGIGQYIANAIELFCHKKPRPLLDVNMARVLERYFGPRKLADIRHDPYLQELAQKIVNCHSPEIINWATLDFASLVCKQARPLCSTCPISKGCLYYKHVD